MSDYDFSRGLGGLVLIVVLIAAGIGLTIGWLL